MDFVTIKAAKREPHKKSAARAERKAGRVPAIVYGKGTDPRAISINTKEFSVHVHGGSRLFNLDVDGVIEHTILKDLAFDTYGLQIIHADFRRVSEKDRLEVHVPVRLLHVNQVELGGGTMMFDLHSVRLITAVTAIPNELVLDVTGLAPGKPKTLADLALPAGAELVGHPSDVIVHISMKVEAAPVAAEAVPAEGAAAAATAEGAKPEAGKAEAGKAGEAAKPDAGKGKK